MKPLTGDQQLQSVSLSYCVALQALNQNPLHEEEGAWMQAPIEVSRRVSGEVFSLDILSHRMSVIAILQQLPKHIETRLQYCAIDSICQLGIIQRGAQAMRQIRYAVAMSLDGYIAGPNGEADWIEIDPEVDFKAIWAQFDTLVMGRRTFEAAKKRLGEAAFTGLKTIVFSRTMKQQEHPEVTVVSELNGDCVQRSAN